MKFKSINNIKDMKYAVITKMKNEREFGKKKSHRIIDTNTITLNKLITLLEFLKRDSVTFINQPNTSSQLRRVISINENNLKISPQFLAEGNAFSRSELSMFNILTHAKWMKSMEMM
jgi:hypothetical protein